MKINNFREYINLPDYKQEEIQGFINKVEDFAKNILPRMDENMKAVLDVTTLLVVVYQQLSAFMAIMKCMMTSLTSSG